MLLGDEPARFGWIESGATAASSPARLWRSCRRRHSLSIRRCSTLSIAQQQLVEIARALLDEAEGAHHGRADQQPSRGRTRSICSQRSRGCEQRGVSIIYISHFLEECRAGRAIASRCLRDGENVGRGEMASARAERHHSSHGRPRGEGALSAHTSTRSGDVVLERERPGRREQAALKRAASSLRSGRDFGHRRARSARDARIRLRALFGARPASRPATVCSRCASRPGDTAQRAGRKGVGSLERESQGGRADAQPQSWRTTSLMTR